MILAMMVEAPRMHSLDSVRRHRRRNSRSLIPTEPGEVKKHRKWLITTTKVLVVGAVAVLPGIEIKKGFDDMSSGTQASLEIQAADAARAEILPLIPPSPEELSDATAITERFIDEINKFAADSKTDRSRIDDIISKAQAAKDNSVHAEAIEILATQEKYEDELRIELRQNGAQAAKDENMARIAAGAAGELGVLLLVMLEVARQNNKRSRRESDNEGLLWDPEPVRRRAARMIE